MSKPTKPYEITICMACEQEHPPMFKYCSDCGGEVKKAIKQPGCKHEPTPNLEAMLGEPVVWFKCIHCGEGIYV